MLVLSGAAKALGVIFEPLPADQQQITVRIGQRALQLVPGVPWHGTDDGLGLPKSLFEGGGLTRDNLQMGDFQYHDDSLS